MNSIKRLSRLFSSDVLNTFSRLLLTVHCNSKVVQHEGLSVPSSFRNNSGQLW